MLRCNHLIVIAWCCTWACAARAVGQSSQQTIPFDGGWDSRPKLTGDWGGLREELRDHGITLDVSATTYYQGTASGGLSDTFEFGGRNDYILNVDGKKSGLWPGLFLNLHGETVYGDSPNLATGAIVPVSIGRSLPAIDGTVNALTSVRVTQALSDNFVLYAGKINTIDNVQQPFMPGKGLDAGFMNGAFVFNPVLGRTIPYSTFGAGAAILANGQPLATLTVYDTHDTSTGSPFHNLFDNGAIIYPTVSVPTGFFDMPGHQTVWAAYSSGRYPILEPQSLTVFPPELSGPLPITSTRGSWWIDYRVDQALWVDPSDQARTWGVFADLGLSDGKPNAVRWSAIAGIGGSSPIPSRKLDSFGIAYYYLALSDSFKDDLGQVSPLLRDEQGLELFYNVAVTRWFHLTADMQVVAPILSDTNTSFVLGGRAQIAF